MSSNDPLVGKVLQGTYRIEALVGKGGMAKVYKAVHTSLQVPLAIKMLLPHLAEEEHVKKRFMDEAKIQFELKHNHIVQVTGVIEDKENDFVGMIMEWIEGDDLQQALRKRQRPLSLKDVWRVMAPVCEAVGFAHDKSLVHRDIKPANILLHRESNGKLVPKVADFGIAKVLDDVEAQTATGIAMGTVKYMPPEQIKDAKRIDHRADIYALGITAYRLITGHFPFTGKQEYLIFQQMTEDPPAPSTHDPKLPKAIDDVILKSIARERDDRYDSCAEFAYELSLALTSYDLDRDDLKVDPGEIYNKLIELPDDETFCDATQNPLPRTLMRPIFKIVDSVNADKKKKKPASSKSVADHSSEETMYVSSSQLGAKKKGGGKGILILFLLLLLAGGGVGAAFMMGLIGGKGGEGSSLSGGAGDPSVSGGGACKEGQKRPCAVYKGPANSWKNAPCKKGTETCSGGKWGECVGQILPKAEICGNGKDDDCDGKIDDGFEKKGKSCTSRVGDCKRSGTWACTDNKKKLVCKVGKDAKVSGPHRYLVVKPKRRFTVKYNGKTKSFRGRYCFDMSSRRIRVKVSGSGYPTCYFNMRRSRRPMVIRMKKRSKFIFDPPRNYCTK